MAFEEAAALFQVAAEADIPQAIYSLALMHEYGTGLEQDNLAAARLYRRGAELNHAESMYNLAMLYATGRLGGEADFERARPLLDGAAQMDHAPAIYYMGVFKTYGYACEVNYAQAINWFERAAGLNDYRVSSKASNAAAELRTKLDSANAYNERLLDKYQQQAAASSLD
jgi:uncharacterized protein